MPVIVGGVFTVLTVSTNVSLAPFTPSLTPTAIVAVPVCPAAGVTVTVRLDPLPPNTMLLIGTSVSLDEPPPNVRLSTGVSASPTVNGIAPVPVPTVANWSEISLIVGAPQGAEPVAPVKPHPPLN